MMHRNRRIAIILSDTLQSIGLQSLLTDYFPPVEISKLPVADLLTPAGNDHFNHYFTTPDIYTAHLDYFLPRRSKTILLFNCGEPASAPSSATHFLTLQASQETILEQLQAYLPEDIPSQFADEGNKELSSREIDVLQQVVKGITNKEIADKLNISLNTVLTHRKNITAKLGIKTLSGLTFYAIINGIISGDEIEL
ncbi:MAG: LuxR C-terminal-related transcriptional regulator [Tannerellaceae bacterium]|nr:LuxR C-terminal-related transcriptional regulator [Tannerellaceae bacterium]MCD8265290.1 LuxR C-terminal-related transcriptional regulator [Tannerellaceae bacterium]